MTRERRLAIQMWEEIATEWEKGSIASLGTLQARFCRMNDLNWNCDCWFCQYVRKDFRSGLPSRHHIDSRTNGCQECPIYRDSPDARGDMCGCSRKANGVWSQLRIGDVDRVKAARRIAELLRYGK